MTYRVLVTIARLCLLVIAAFAAGALIWAAL